VNSRTAPLLGCIADDFTGGTDLAGILVKAGMRTVQTVGVPNGPISANVDAVVVALKSRTTPASDAIEDSLAALRWLRAAGCRQFYFKYCSTFDSTAEGNIGPVAQALAEELGTSFTIVCPAFPANKRTVYQGHLFVGETLLNESGMQNHPLTPMRDANLVRVLQAQLPLDQRVGLVKHASVAQGAGGVTDRFAQLQREGIRFAIADAISDADLTTLGRACADLPLVTGGSGLAMGLPANFKAAGLLKDNKESDQLTAPAGRRAVLSGSCSSATRRQVAQMCTLHPSFYVDPAALARGEDVVSAALDFASQHLDGGPVLIHAGAAPEAVQATQRELGAQRAGALIEDALATIAQGLIRMGVRRLIVAGGETSGAVVKSLHVDGLHIGPEIDPGVPWTVTTGDQPIALALKSGNFGSDDFFLKAWERLK
jgi:uncharacterized protein YgbK (DUF1537 family)